MKAMILAAGLGTRLAPYTDILAKPAIPFLNIPLFYYSIALLRAGGFELEECVINSHHLADQIHKLAKELKGLRTQITYEKEKPLGSGGGVWFAREFLKNEKDFVITNGDEVILPTHLDLLPKMLKQHQTSGAIATLLVKRDPRVGTQFGGVWTSTNRQVHGFGKQSPREGLEGLHYVGVMIMAERAFQYFPEGESNILYDSMMNAYHKGEKIEVFIDDCRWFETGNIKDFLSATREVLELSQKMPQDPFLSFLFKEFAPNSRLVAPMIFADQSAQLSSEARLSGFVILGANVKVPAGCELHNVCVRAGVKLEAKTYRDDLVL